MPFDRKKLIALRNNVQAMIGKIEREDKLGNLDNIISENTNGAITAAFAQMESRMEQAMSARGGGDLEEVIEKLGRRITSAYSSASPKDRTDEVITAISNIRFPEVNFPNTVSIDNFPPQKIPNPVTNIKATIVGDTTGLLGGDTVHKFGEQTVAAGNTVALATYTVPVDLSLLVKGVYAEGIDDGLFALYIDSTKVWQARNSWTQRNVESDIQFNSVATGLVVELRVTNLKNLSKQYSGGFYGIRVNP
jgi:hypothetical protein